MTTKKGAVPALRFTLGGAPPTFHTVGELPGLWHPTIAVPVDVLGLDEEWAQKVSNEKGVPLELVLIPEDAADAGREAYGHAMGLSRKAVLEAARHPVAGAHADRVLAEHAHGKGEQA